MAVYDARPWDPLRNYTFRVMCLRGPPAPASEAAASLIGGGAALEDLDSLDVSYIAGVNKVSGLSVSIEATEVWEGGNHRHRYANPERATWDPITLEQGLAIDGQLERWAQAALSYVTTGAKPALDVKRNVLIDVWDPLLHPPGGKKRTEGLLQDAKSHTLALGAARLKRFLVFNAWVSNYQALPALDAMGSEIALLSVELTHEGWRELPATELPSDLAKSAATPLE